MAQAQAEITDLAPRTIPAEAAIVIIGNGPAGMQVARELLQRKPDLPIVIYGDEHHQPYNRVKLSSLLAGDVAWDKLAAPIEAPRDAIVEERYGIEVRHIHPENHTVEEMDGRLQPYNLLILATGSRPHIPTIPGIDLPGVFTFRNLDDTQQLLARQARSHHTVVLGGGLMGMEAARGMQRANTRVTLIEHGDRLLGAQLDEEGARCLQRQVEALGIEIRVGDGVRQVMGEARVTGVRLRSGRLLSCDTLIVATGIRPRIELAREAGIAVGRGIRVDDRMQTSVPRIYAVGECAEHRGRVYGLVAPGLEQAAVAASHITGQQSRYSGSIVASHLKIVGCPVFSAGPMGADATPLIGQHYVYRDPQRDIYRRLLVHRHRLAGAIGIGPWSENRRLQQAINRRQFLWPWQRWRFSRTGQIWPQAEEQSVALWPAATTVCQCTGASRGAIDAAIRNGSCDLAAISQRTGAASVCGSCRPLVQQLLGAVAPQPAPGHRLLQASAVLGLLGALFLLLWPALPYPDSVRVAWRWDVWWRDGLLKQISGFAVLGLFVLGLALSPRKRLQRLRTLGRFHTWRLAHIALGLLVIGGLVVHTGGRLGQALNLLLMLSFSLTLLAGAVASGVIGLEHRIGGALATRLRRQSVWGHILLFWPVPVLLGFHILKGYWY